VNTALPVVSGSPQVGQMPSCSRGSWSGTTPISYAYEWDRDGVAIAGANGSAHTVQVADAGHALTCKVTASNVGGSSSATSAPVNVPPHAPPPPQSGRDVNVFPVSGTVLVKLPGHRGFTRLAAGEQIPVGSIVDVTNGRVTLVSARSVRGGKQTADFYGGKFMIGQHRGQALTTLKLMGGNFRTCGRHAGDLAPIAGLARRRPRRHLWGSGSGSFSTSGNSASGTVRGTIWLTEDDCEGTLIHVQRGTVVVRDFVRKKTIVVHAPHSYFAHP
jgi:hypothetical protein